MPQEQKKLLLKDLCARLPYDIKFPITTKNPVTSGPIETIGIISGINRYGIVSFVWDYEGQEILVKDSLHIKDVKPYLFPLSDMVKEVIVVGGNRHIATNIDWLNANHLDYRGLIEKGLAIDATGLNIY